MTQSNLYDAVIIGGGPAGALTAGDATGARFQAYGDRVCPELEAMRKLVYAFYDAQFNFGRFLKKYPRLRGDLTDCLIGRLTHDFGPLFNAMAEFVKLPAPLGHGGALVPAGALD